MRIRGLRRRNGVQRDQGSVGRRGLGLMRWGRKYLGSRQGDARVSGEPLEEVAVLLIEVCNDHGRGSMCVWRGRGGGRHCVLLD